MKSATQKLSDLRQRQADLAAEEKALLDARLGEIAVIVDRCGGATLTDEMVAGAVRLAVNGNDQLRERLHQDGATFLGGSRRRGAGKSRPVPGAAGPSSGIPADLAPAAANAANAGEAVAKDGEGAAKNG